MADNPYVGDAHQGASTSGEMAGNPYVGDNYGALGSSPAEEASETPGQEASENEGRTAPSEFSQPTTQDTARHDPGAIAHYQN